MCCAFRSPAWRVICSVKAWRRRCGWFPLGGQPPYLAFLGRPSTHAAASGVTDRGWEIFNQIREAFDGACSPGDYENFGFSNPQSMRPHIRNLEDANLVQSKLADDDKRRKTITITPSGWLVSYKLAGFRFL